MIVHQVYAIISNGIIENICVCDDYEVANYLARASYGNEAIAVDCLQYRCAIGDRYHDGEFYHVDKATGTENIIQREPTQEQKVAELEETNKLLEECILELSIEIYAE